MKKALIRLTLTTFQEMEVDLEELVAEYGKKALTKSFLEDYAYGNREEGVVIDDEIEIEFEQPEPIKKVRRGRGSY